MTKKINIMFGNDLQYCLAKIDKNDLKMVLKIHIMFGNDLQYCLPIAK